MKWLDRTTWPLTGFRMSYESGPQRSYPFPYLLLTELRGAATDITFYISPSATPMYSGSGANYSRIVSRQASFTVTAMISEAAKLKFPLNACTLSE